MHLLNSFATIICPLNSRESDAEGLRILRGPIKCQNQSCNDHHHHQCHQYHPHPRHLQPYTHLNASLMGQQALVAATSPSAYISQVSKKEKHFPGLITFLTSPRSPPYFSELKNYVFYIKQHLNMKPTSQQFFLSLKSNNKIVSSTPDGDMSPSDGPS